MNIVRKISSTLSKLMTKHPLPPTPNLDRLVAASTKSSDKLDLLGMSQTRVEQIATDIERNPHKHPGKNPLAKAVIAEGLAEIKRGSQAPANVAKPKPAPVNPLAEYSDRMLEQRASHSCSPEVDKAAAIAELARRGIRYSNGIFSKSFK